MNRIRTQGIYNADGWSATVIGVGGIGAVLAINLAKMGLNPLTIIDGDEVSEENTGTQLYGAADIAARKVTATKDTIRYFSEDTQVAPLGGFVTPGVDWKLMQSPLVISAVDSIESRKDIWEVIKNERWMYYIDARMGAENLLIYTVAHRDKEWYDAMIAGQNDEDIPDLPCTAKATFYNGSIAAGFIAANVRKIITSVHVPKVLSLDVLNSQLVTI